MSVKFDNSLETLVTVCQELGVTNWEELTFVRDGVGRLIVASGKSLRQRSALTGRMREALGSYCAPMCVVDGRNAIGLLRDPSIRHTTTHIYGTTITVRYADRRIVGADWLSPNASGQIGPTRLVFASLKGGVGRSTALSVLAADLARAGKRVLAVDLDIEAPGIGFMLLPASEALGEDKRPKYGAVDYLVENGLNGFTDEELIDCIGTADFARGFVDVIPAVGRVTDDNPSSMLAKLSRAMVEDVGPSGSLSVGEQMSSMIERFASYGEYDAILIDARAGMAELSAAPLISLGAEVLLFGTDQQQTYRGYRYLLSHIAGFAFQPHSFEWQAWRDRLTFVQSKASSSASKRSSYRQSIYGLCAELLYDREYLDERGRVATGSFNPSPDEEGLGVPHDATYIENHPDYEAFDPTSDGTQLDTDVYNGPFGNFLKRSWALLGFERPDHYE